MRVSEDPGQGPPVSKELSLPPSSSQSILEAALTPSPKYPAMMSEGTSPLPCLLGALLHGRPVGKGSDLVPHAWFPAQRNEWCSTLQKKVTDQRLVGSRPRPTNTAHCQKSGILELKGQKSKVFAALSLPEMWLYKSEQVCGWTRHPAGTEGCANGGRDESDGGT